MKTIITTILISFLFINFANANITKTTPTSFADLQLSFAPIVKKVSPAVVNIYSLNSGITSDEKKRIENSLGSGVVVKSEGLIITNNHVIKNADQIVILFNDKRQYRAEILGIDETTDLAVLKILTSDSEVFPYIEMADSEAVQVGDLALAIGNPFGIGQTVTMGIISAVSRERVNSAGFNSYIQTDAAINPGNSGGALINIDGRLIGVPTTIISNSGKNSGIGLATPTRMIEKVVMSIVDEGEVIRPLFGAILTDVNSNIKNQKKLSSLDGVYVVQVVPDTPAEEYGIKPGDVIYQIDDLAVSDNDEFNFRIDSFYPNDEIEVSLIRNGKQEKVNVILGEPSNILSESVINTSIINKGYLKDLEIAELIPSIKKEYNLTAEKGIVIVDPNNSDLANKLGLKKGDVILDVNSAEVSSVSDFMSVLDHAKSGISLNFMRGSSFMSATARW